MTRFQPLVAVVKRQYELALTEPNHAFFTAFAIAMLLGPVMISVIAHPLPLDTWGAAIAVITCFAGFLAAAVAIHRAATHLTLFVSLCLVAQALAGSFGLWAAGGTLLGYIARLPGSWETWPAFGLVWSVLSLACVIGLIRDRWWGYMGEVIVLCSLAAVSFLVPAASKKTPTLYEGIAGLDLIKLACVWSLFAGLNWKLLQKGWRRLKGAPDAP